VQLTLESLGYQRVKDPEKAHRVARWIPSHLDETASFWIQRELNWIAFFSESHQAIQVELYCQPCSTFPKSQEWNPLGAGWGVFEEVLSQIQEKQRRIRTVQKKVIQGAQGRDPREIVF
jgi:hypothetical protein